MSQEGEKITKNLKEKLTVSTTLSIRHDIIEAKELIESVKEGFRDLSSSATVVQRPIADKTYEKLLELEKKIALIEKQTRPQTWWQKLRDTIFSELVGYIIAAFIGAIFLYLGLRIFSVL